ncbi:hypothetical protein DFQ26_000650, partial [Actinomortierella ambigua]
MEANLINFTRRLLLDLGKSFVSGAFGAVHEARWSNQPCAAKTFFFGESDFHQHANQKDISLDQTLRHRHIIQFYRTHQEDGKEKVLHRDLKSTNVLLTRHTEVKLADFGLTKVRSLASAASMADQSKGGGGGLAGTLRWIAPELLYASKLEYSAKSDVYAFGVVMWEMAAN